MNQGCQPIGRFHVKVLLKNAADENAKVATALSAEFFHRAEFFHPSAAFEKDTTAIMSTNSDLGRMLKSMAEAVAPPKPPH